MKSHVIVGIFGEEEEIVTALAFTVPNHTAFMLTVSTFSYRALFSLFYYSFTLHGILEFK